MVFSLDGGSDGDRVVVSRVKTDSENGKGVNRKQLEGS
jgi:hypothetical protein